MSWLRMTSRWCEWRREMWSEEYNTNGSLLIPVPADERAAWKTETAITTKGCKAGIGTGVSRRSSTFTIFTISSTKIVWIRQPYSLIHSRSSVDGRKGWKDSWISFYPLLPVASFCLATPTAWTNLISLLCSCRAVFSPLILCKWILRDHFFRPWLVKSKAPLYYPPSVFSTSFYVVFALKELLCFFFPIRVLYCVSREIHQQPWKVLKK